MSEKDDKQAEIAARATRADVDTEEKLDGLFRMVVSRRKDPDLEVAYELTRDELVKQLAEEGPRYFLDSDGNKRYAFVVAPEVVEVDYDEVIKCIEEGLIPDDVVDKVWPRKLDKDALRRAVSKGDISDEVFVRIAEFVKKTAHVGFSDPVD